MTDAISAPATPRRGKGPKPKMSNGSNTMLTKIENHRTRIAITASPAPRKTLLITKSIITTGLHPRTIEQ